MHYAEYRQHFAGIKFYRNELFVLWEQRKSVADAMRILAERNGQRDRHKIRRKAVTIRVIQYRLAVAMQRELTELSRHRMEPGVLAFYRRTCVSIDGLAKAMG